MALRHKTWIPFSGIYTARDSFDTPLTNQGGGLAFTIDPVDTVGSPCTILATRGFWDVSISVTRGDATVLAFGMAVVNKVVAVDSSDIPLPNLLTYPDTNGYFVFEPFVQLSGAVSQDPPFHSKAKRKMGKGDIVTVVFSWQTIEPPRSASLGVVGRMLVGY